VAARRDREFWERACREVRRGETVSDVARRLGVKPRTLQWWSWKLRQEGAVGSEFLPVVVGEQASASLGAALELETHGIRLRVEVGSDVAYVAALLAAIRAAC
jgi:transposase-like protein